MKSKFLRIILPILLGIILFTGGIALAVTVLKTIPVDLTITTPAPIYSLEVYADSACSPDQVVSLLHWGNQEVGTTRTWTFYVKNTGDQAFTLYTTSSSVSWGTVIFTPATNSNFAPGAILPVTMSISINSNATPGTQSFNINLSY